MLIQCFLVFLLDYNLQLLLCKTFKRMLWNAMNLFLYITLSSVHLYTPTNILCQYIIQSEILFLLLPKLSPKWPVPYKKLHVLPNPNTPLYRQEQWHPDACQKSVSNYLTTIQFTSSQMEVIQLKQKPSSDLSLDYRKQPLAWDNDFCRIHFGSFPSFRGSKSSWWRVHHSDVEEEFPRMVFVTRNGVYKDTMCFFALVLGGVIWMKVVLSLGRWVMWSAGELLNIWFLSKISEPWVSSGKSG